MPNSKKGTAGSGSIRKKTITKPNGKKYTYWEARITVGIDSWTGRQKQRSVSGKTEREVAQKLRQIAAEKDSGAYVEPVKLIAIQDRNLHNFPQYANPICKIFFLCRALGGSFQENIETTESGFFSLEELPALNGDKNTLEQIEMCFDAAADPDWKTLFD